MAGGTPRTGRRDKKPAVSCSMVSVVSAVTSACSRCDLCGLLAGRSRPRAHRAFRVLGRSWGRSMTGGPSVRAQPGSCVASDDGQAPGSDLADVVRQTARELRRLIEELARLVYDATAGGA
jgi:hypothetical protein